jgi:hypothetical protein
MVKVNVLILRKNGLGHILGNFFTNSSGHPAWQPYNRRKKGAPANLLHVLFYDSDSKLFFKEVSREIAENKFAFILSRKEGSENHDCRAVNGET